MNRRSSPSMRSGITRIEVVFIAIAVFTMLALLFSFLLSLRYNESHPQKVQCINNMKNLALAMSQVASIKGEYPPAQRMNKEDEIQYGWRIVLLPFLEQQLLYDEIMANLPWDSEHNRQFEDEMPFIFACPVFPDLMPRQTSYQVIVGPETPFEGNRRTSLDDFERGKSNTILIVETSQGVSWSAPIDLPYANLDHGIVPLKSKLWSVGSGHQGSAVVAFADGSVRSLDFSQIPVDVIALKTMALLKAPKVLFETDENGDSSE